MSQVIGENNLPFEVESQSEPSLNFSVEQIDEVCTRLKDKGVLFLNEPHDRKEWNARVALFRDPDGNVIELYKHPL
jgi:lactoylglutathione lyase